MKEQANSGSELPSRFKKWSSLVALVIFAITAALLLHRSLLPGYTLIPLDIIQDIKPWDHLDLGSRANRLLIDPFFIFYPNRALQTAAIQNGQLMLWNPYLFTGTPVIADPNFQPFYLPNLLFSLILPVHAALPWLAWAHLTLTGLFMYLFLRKKRLLWFAAILGGGVWLLNGYLLVWLENPHRLSTAAWFPAIFWTFEIAVQENKPRWAAIGGLFLGLSILGGQIQFIVYLGLVLAIYTLIQCIFRYRDGLSRITQPIFYLIVIAIIGLSIGALVLIPAAEFSNFSQRTLFDSSSILDTRWPVQQLITLIAPDFYGNPAGPVNYWGAVNYAEVTAYFGIIPFLLALSAVFVARDRRFLITIIILLVTILFLSLGTPLVRLLEVIPGFQFLALRRTLIFIPFFGAWLAALGMDGWMQSGLSPRVRLTALAVSLTLILILVLAVISFFNPSLVDHWESALPTLRRAVFWLAITIPLLFALNRRPIVIAPILILLTFAELIQWGYKFNPIISTDYLYPENEVTNYLLQDDTQFRVLPLQAEKAVFGPNILSIFQIESITGYSSLIHGDYADLIKTMDDDIDIGWMRGNENILVMSHFHPLVGMLNVKYVLSAVELGEISELQTIGEFDGVWIYEVVDAGSRAFLVNDVEVVSKESTLPILVSEDFNWKNSAIIANPLPTGEADQLSPDSDISNSLVNIINYESGSVTLSVDTPEPAFLVLADAYYPGWQAFLDGQSVPIHQTNLVMRGLFVPAGNHEISFQFVPTTLKVGLVLAIVGMSLALVICFKDWGNRKN